MAYDFYIFLPPFGGSPLRIKVNVALRSTLRYLCITVFESNLGKNYRKLELEGMDGNDMTVGKAVKVLVFHFEQFDGFNMINCLNSMHVL